MVVPDRVHHHGRMTGPRGTTLIELLFVLLLLGVLLALALPPLGRWRDAAATRSARDELAAGLAWTRLSAVSHGGSTLVVDAATGRFWTTTPGGPIRPPVSLRDRYDVRLDVGAEDRVILTFDALGLGRTASRTIRVRRGRAEAGLIISGYGRFRRW